jgi:acetylglutamate/LysW-gamma-L-alpha-aminoadipate kinase
VKHISRAELESREAQVEGRMKRKMLALKKLAASGARILISDGRVEHPIRDALDEKGTTIR